MLGVKDRAVKLEPHSTEWEAAAKETINVLKGILGDAAVDIQHVGSTSVIGLRAKPIIDIAVGVKSIQDAIDLSPVLESRGFFYRPRTASESQILFACRDFKRNMDTHYIHVVVYGSSEWNNYIKFRDVLNKNENTRRQYEDLKLRLSKEFAEDRMEYTKCKSAFIKSILDLDDNGKIKIIKGSIEHLYACEEALVNSELGVKYFSEKGSARKILKKGFAKDDIYVAIDEKNNFQGFIWFVFEGMFHAFPYLHIIAVKEESRNKGIGKKLLKFFEDICFKDNTKVFLVVADFNPNAKRLYERIGYTEVGVIPDLYREGITEHLMMKLKGNKGE